MFHNEKLTILYGSQTGNAQDLAERIWRESSRYYFISTIQPMDDYNIIELIDEKFEVIFVCSTTGQGEEPDNMKIFWKFLLKKSLKSDILSNMKFAVFGLGDSSYTKFNFAAKRLHKRLLQLGAKCLQPLGLGDDQHDLGYDGAADPWCETLWTKLLQLHPLPSDVQPLPKNRPIFPKWTVILKDQIHLNKPQSIYYSTRKSDEFDLTVLENKKITSPDHFQDVRLIRFQIDQQTYKPGDIIVLRPRNLDWQIMEFKDVLQENGVTISDDTVLLLKENQQGYTVPSVLHQKLTFQQLCEEYFDLMSIPRRHTFNVLAQLTDHELEKEKCMEFTTAEGQNDLYTYCNRPKRNIVEVLRDFPNATKNLTKDMLFELLPAIKPREFSIASNSNYHRNEIHILLAVVRYKTKLFKERLGLCSNYLAGLAEGDRLTGWFRKGSFNFPQDGPVIMVGPGTGIAPFRNYIYERVTTNQARDEDLLLFFGCRNRHNDFHCKDELMKLQNECKLNLITAFSREQETKIYVQHKIIENSDCVWKMLERKASIFIAGNAKFMPEAVRNAFIDVCQISGKMSKNDAQIFMKNMEKDHRYQTECWS